MFNVLKFCDKNIMFSIIDFKNLDIVFCLFVFFCLIFMLFLQFKNIMEKTKIWKLKKYVNIFFVVSFFAFSFGATWYYFNHDDYLHCMSEYTDVNIDNKVVIAGDSRMELIEHDNNIVVPYNVSFIAKSGAAIEWFVDEAFPKLENIIKNKNDDFKYSFVVNMGVNDLQWTGSVKNTADNYFYYYSKLANLDNDINLYIMSVNPIKDELLNKNVPNNKRTNAKVEEFNKKMYDDFKNSKTDNMFYCDSYNAIDFVTEDGIHYNEKTNEKIMSYLLNHCIIFS